MTAPVLGRQQTIVNRQLCANNTRQSRATLVAMIIGGLLTVAPVFGPLANTLHYLADFIAERPQPTRLPDISFFAELLALIVCPFGLVIFAISLVFYIRSGKPTAPQGDNDVRI